MSARKQLEGHLADKRIKLIHDSVKTAFESRDFIAHNWDHIYRDTINAIRVGEAEGADMQIVVPAILLHDIGFLYDSNPAVHHRIGAEKCAEWLIGWGPAEKAAITACILSHKGNMSGFGVEPSSLEARVVHDADLLEKIGKIGILQSVMTYVEFGLGGVEHHQVHKNLYAIVKRGADIGELKFYTRTGKELSAERGGHRVRREFFNELLAELEEYER